MPPDDKALAILEHLREGCGTRATGRLAKVGSYAEALHDQLVALSPSDPWGPGLYGLEVLWTGLDGTHAAA